LSQDGAPTPAESADEEPSATEDEESPGGSSTYEGPSVVPSSGEDDQATSQEPCDEEVDQELPAESEAYEEGQGMSEEAVDSDDETTEAWREMFGPRRLTVEDAMRWSEYDPWTL
jgi:hypothetical protein